MKHYFPSNGTEGMAFQEMNCQLCAKDTQLRGGKTYCTILSGSMINPPPVKQWIYNEDKEPTCTSFKKIGSVKKKSGNTLNMLQL